MEIRENVQLIEVGYENDYKTAILTFLDEDKGQILEVKFNRQKFENGKYVDSEEKAKKVDEWCEEYFELPYDKLNQAIGKRMTVYHYEYFNSLWESEYPQKFDDDSVGQIFTTKIDEIEDDGIGIRINYTIDGTLYRTNMTYSKYVEERKAWFVDPVRKEKQYTKFKEKFGVDFEDNEKIIGKEIMVEVKKAFGKHTYGDIKKPAWSKK